MNRKILSVLISIGLVAAGIAIYMQQTVVHPPMQVKASLKTADGELLIDIKGSSGGSPATSYFVKTVGGGPTCHRETPGTCSLSAQNYQYTEVLVQASNSAGKSRWKTLAGVPANRQVKACAELLIGWTMYFANAVQTNDSATYYDALYALRSAGLLWALSPGVGGVAGEWIRANSAKQAFYGGADLSNQTVGRECETLGAQSGSMSGFPSAPGF